MTVLKDVWDRRPRVRSVDALHDWMKRFSGPPAAINRMDQCPVDRNLHVIEGGQCRCQLCANLIAPCDESWVHWGDPERCLAVHRQCHATRAGLTSAGIVAALKAGNWFISEVMKVDEAAKWKVRLFDHFVGEHGAQLGEFVIGSKLEWWDRVAGVRDTVELVRLTRDLYLLEREPPKFEALGVVVPRWDPASLPWEAYKRKRPPGPFYAVLEAAQARCGKPITKYQPKPAVLGRTAGACANCGDQIDVGSGDLFDLRRDHILPVCKGGSNELINFQSLHHLCNAAKSSLSGGHIPLALASGRWLIDQCCRDSHPIWIDKASNDRSFRSKFNR